MRNNDLVSIDASDLNKWLDGFVDALEQTTPAIVRETAFKTWEYLQTSQKAFTRRTGHLEKSFIVKSDGDTWQVENVAKYAAAIEFGRKAVKPKNAEWLVFQIDGNWIRTKYCKPAEARPYMRPAAKYAQREIVRDVAYKYLFWLTNT